MSVSVWFILSYNIELEVVYDPSYYFALLKRAHAHIRCFKLLLCTPSSCLSLVHVQYLHIYICELNINKTYNYPIVEYVSSVWVCGGIYLCLSLVGWQVHSLSLTKKGKPSPYPKEAGLPLHH